MKVKLTHGAGIGGQGLAPIYVDCMDKKGQTKIYDRYVQCLAFSHDDKQFVASIKNGPDECHIKVYDLIMKSQAMS